MLCYVIMALAIDIKLLTFLDALANGIAHAKQYCTCCALGHEGSLLQESHVVTEDKRHICFNVFLINYK